MEQSIRALTQQVVEESAFLEALFQEVGKVIIGQRAMLERVAIGLLCNGHILLEGVPGLAKTLTVRAFAQAIQASFQRVQFTPDLLPADLIGTVVFHHQTGNFSVRKGPIFANVVLADEINRAPAKVQSALLEAMQERQVTIGSNSFALPAPFFVLATQNPIEQEGTYPLPEAQVDRFLLKVKVDYPSREEEKQLLGRTGAGGNLAEVAKWATPEQILRVQEVVQRIYMDEKLKDYILDIVFATREPAKCGAKDLAGFIEYGASPRATLALMNAAKAHAFLRHRGFVTPEDIKAIGMDVLRHRLSLSFEAEAEGVDAQQVVQRIFERIEVP